MIYELLHFIARALKGIVFMALLIHLPELLFKIVSIT